MSRYLLRTGASVKAALLGRSYTNLGGFANLTTDEMTALTDSVADNAVKMSGDQVTAVDKFDTASRGLRDTIGGLTTGVGSALIPVLTNSDRWCNGRRSRYSKKRLRRSGMRCKEVWVELKPTLEQLGTTLTKDLLPALQKMWNAISPVLIPVVKIFIGLLVNRLLTTFKDCCKCDQRRSGPADWRLRRRVASGPEDRPGRDERHHRCLQQHDRPAPGRQQD